MERAKSMKSLTTTPQIFVKRPSPYDFVAFVPWVCKEYEVEVAVHTVFRGTRYLTEHEKLFSEIASAKNMKITIDRKSKGHSIKSVGLKNEKIDSGSSIKALEVIIPDESKIAVTAIFDYSHNLLSLQIMNNVEVPRTVFQVIALIIEFYPTLTSLTADRGIDAYSIHEITKLLDISSISEVCLDGTQLRNPNYYILLETKSNLNCLSLAKCQIDDEMIKKIAENLALPHPSSKTLLFLNISSNRITDIGAAHLADALKTNRHLTYLNLADNHITDTGASQIFDKMLAFPILSDDLDQLKLRRRVYLDKKNKLFNKYVTQLKNTEEIKSTKRKGTSKMVVGNSKSRRKENKKTEDWAMPSLKPPSDVKLFDKAENLALRTMGPFEDPFESSLVKDDIKYCKGNNTLTCLNLAFNSLSYNSLLKLIEVLNYQKNNQQTPRGLFRVRLEGNYLPSTCEEYTEINELLDLALDVTTKKPMKHLKSGSIKIK